MTAQNERSLYYVSVIERGSRFVEALDAPRGLDRPIYPTLQRYLRKHHRLIEADVELAGRVYRAPVYVPHDVADTGYIVADAAGVPIGEQPATPLDREALQPYIAVLRERVAYSEAIFAEQSCYLWNQFVRPTVFELRAGQARQRRNWESLLRFPRVVILGSAGVGKTTSLRRLALELTSPDADSDLAVPVYVQLRHSQRNEDLLQRVSRELIALNRDWRRNDTERLASTGQLFLLLDGVDEAPDEIRAQVLEAIAGTAKRFPRLRMMISCRTSAYDWRLADFAHVEIAPFNKAQVREWSAYKLPQQHAYRFFSWMAELPSLLSLFLNPLSLSTAATLFIRNGLSVRDAAQVLHTCVSVFTDQWDAMRGVNRCAEPWAAPHRKLRWLARAAAVARTGADDGFHEADADLPLGVERPADMPLRTAQHTDLITATRTTAEYRFKHRAIADYLAALYSVERPDDVESSFRRDISRPEWQRVWRYACGITPDASRLLKIALEADTLGEIERARLLADAVSQNISISAGVPTLPRLRSKLLLRKSGKRQK